MRFIKDAAINENGLVFNPFTGDSFIVNDMGKTIIDYLKKNSSVEEIRDKLFEQYDVELRILERDIYDFLEKLKTYHLLEQENDKHKGFEMV